MPHYICTGGCKGESETAGVCQAENCLKHGMPLDECNCKDRSHFGAFDDRREEEEYEFPKDKRESR